MPSSRTAAAKAAWPGSGKRLRPGDSALCNRSTLRPTRASRSRSCTRTMRGSTMPTRTTGFTIRHYCQGIGDCHLLRFEKERGGPYWMLIDCGIHTSIKGGSKIIDDIVTDLYETTGGVIDVLVLTHEHTDHISAFRESADRFAPFTIGEVWMSWTESPTDPQAQELDRFKQQALKALSGVSRQLFAAADSDAATAAAPLRASIDEPPPLTFRAQGGTGRRT